MASKAFKSPVRPTDFVLFEETIRQPLDHFVENSETFTQRVFLYIPKTHASPEWSVEPQADQTLRLSSLSPEEIASLASVPVFFVLGNEGHC